MIHKGRVFPSRKLPPFSRQIRLFLQKERQYGIIFSNFNMGNEGLPRRLSKPLHKLMTSVMVDRRGHWLFLCPCIGNMDVQLAFLKGDGLESGMDGCKSLEVQVCY